MKAYYLRAPHFTSHSGYELAVRPVAETRGIAGVGQRWPRQGLEEGARGTPRREWRWPLARGVQRVISRLAGNEGYSTGGLALELSALLRMSRSHGEVFHFLYGENTCRFLPLFDGWRGHRVIATFHQTSQQLQELIQRPAYLKHLSAAIILGHNQADFLGRFIAPPRLHVIPHGVDTTYYHPPQSARPRHDPPLCVSIGGTLRDFVTLRGAIDRLAAKGVPVQYEIIARGDQLPYVQGLTHARVRSWVDEEEFRRLYQQADLFVLPLHDVVASNVLLEALACAAPTVLTDVGDARDYVDEECVLFARPGDPDSLAAAMERCLRDAAFAGALGTRGRDRVTAFRLDVIAGLHTDLYRALLGGASGAPLAFSEETTLSHPHHRTAVVGDE
ncbi:MAG: glycosyltransferase family 4 protein [Chloroflexota bacterium]|nr:glycosyltransferase family 4 protein [Chloroflexota bacterium]